MLKRKQLWKILEKYTKALTEQNFALPTHS